MRQVNCRGAPPRGWRQCCFLLAYPMAEPPQLAKARSRMCVFCGVPDPSHDLLLVRLGVLGSGAVFILTPRQWLRRIKDRVTSHSAPSPTEQAEGHDTSK